MVRKANGVAPASARPIVFVGPSLPHTNARAILAADYRPPIRRGDLDAIAGHRVVAIIDGVFDQELAVSPAEIRDAIERGVRVLGSSSMGALRASEVPGMVGVGHVYEQFRSGRIEDDDEVAIVFHAEDLRPLSEPMVNIRHAVGQLVRSGTLAKRDGDALLRAAKRLPYRARVYSRVLRDAGLADRPESEQLLTMLRSHDLKRDDAIALLERLPDERPGTAVGRKARDASPSAPSAQDDDTPAADAPVFFWEFGDKVDFRALLRFMKLTGTFARHARAAVARFALDGNTIRTRRRGGPTRREALAALEARVGGAWDWTTEEDVSVTMRDLGVDVERFHERLREEVGAEQALMALAREESDEFLDAMRAELLLDELALKREATRCASLERLAARGRAAGGPLTPDELGRATRKLFERVDAVDMKRATKVLGWWGVSSSEVQGFVETLAFARRFAEASPPPSRARRRKRARGFELRKRPKLPNEKRFCTSLADAYAAARRLAPLIGVTRLGVITALGDIGVPNVQAFRPDGRWSNTVGSGKSVSLVGAKVGAIMEELEKWAQEQFPRPGTSEEIEATFASLGDERAIDPATLALPFDSSYRPDRPIGWRRCMDLLRGESVLVPSAAIQFDRVKNDIFYSTRAGRKIRSTNGLASGFTLEEALTHAVCEVVERHSEVVATIGSSNPGCLAGWPHHAFVDLATIPPSSRKLVDKIRAAGHGVVVLDITGEIAVPTFAATILLDDPDGAPWFGLSRAPAPGYATHPDPEVALNMAILEATQSVICTISGASEDLTLHARSLGRHERTRARTWTSFARLRGEDLQTKHFAAVPGYVSNDARADLEWVFARLEASGCDRLLAVDFTVPEIRPARVVRVIIPGLETTNPFHIGTRPRLALLRDLLPRRGP